MGFSSLPCLHDFSTLKVEDRRESDAGRIGDRAEGIRIVHFSWDWNSHGVVQRSPTSLPTSLKLRRAFFASGLLLQWLAIRNFLQGSEEWRNGRDCLRLCRFALRGGNDLLAKLAHAFKPGAAQGFSSLPCSIGFSAPEDEKSPLNMRALSWRNGRDSNPR